MEEISRTKSEQLRHERNEEILNEYSRMLRELPEVKPWRILRTIGDKFGLTPDGVKVILVKQGAYVNINHPKC